MTMPKIAFFIELKNNQATIEGADLNIGNPGVGGTQYLFLLTVKVLNSIYGEDYSVLLTNTRFSNSDPGLHTDYSENVKEAIQYCERHQINNLVLNANEADRVDAKVFDTRVRIMLWAHNTLNAKRQKIAAETKSIRWVVCVSKSQYLNMSDTPCFGKCTYINNVIPSYFFEQATLSDYSEQKVAYVGSLMPQKGAHNLLEIWKYVEEKLPHAQLYIFGGANVWNANAKLGSGGYADPFYERVLQKRLKKLSHPENIHFMGAKGWDFIDSFIPTFRLGIVNPSHYRRDETFCLSAIEMAAHGLPVVSRQRHDGLATTVFHNKTGYLEKNDKEIADRIISIVSDPEKSRKMGLAGREYAEAFLAKTVVPKWRELAENQDDAESAKGIAFFSKDASMLRRDFLLKMGFLFESGKTLGILKKKLKVGK